MNHTLTACLMVALAGLAPRAAGAQAPSAAPGYDCGSVTVARMDWPSAEIIAEMDAMILDAAYGCDVEHVPGETLPTIESMIEEGHPDISPETWINSAREAIDTAVQERRLHYLAPALVDGGVEGWWIPQYVAEANPDIETIADALARPDLFPSPADPAKGAVHNCPEGWICEIATGHLFEAYDAEEKGFELLPSPDGAALEQSIADAFADRRGWLGYYWAPNPALGRYNMVKLGFDAPYDEELWNTCMTDPACPAPAVTAWPRSEVYTVATEDFVRRGGRALDYLRARAWGNDIVNGLLAWQADNATTSRQTALHFLRMRPDVWTQWLDPASVTRVERFLSQSQSSKK